MGDAGAITVSTRLRTPNAIYHVLRPPLIVLRASDDVSSRVTQRLGVVNQLRVLLTGVYESSGHRCLRPLWLW